MVIAHKIESGSLVSYMVVLRILAGIGLHLLLSGCLMISQDKSYQALNVRDKSEQQVYKLYPGEVKPTSDLAIIDLGDVPFAKIDGLRVNATDYQVIHLLPGQHMLAWRKIFGFSVMVEPSMMRAVETAITVELHAGHAYKLFADRTHGAGYKLYFWIEDTADGKVIGGTKKP